MSTIDFDGTSATGKLVYALLCTEAYALKAKPDADWSPLFRKLWEVVTGVYWDNWGVEVNDYIPEYTFEFQSYEESGFETLTKAEYDKIASLHEGMPAEWNELLTSLRDVAIEYGYDCDDPNGYGFDALQNILRILRSSGVGLPSINPASISGSDDNRGYGSPIDPKEYSAILR